jgi:hypothetical protein
MKRLEHAYVKVYCWERGIILTRKKARLPREKHNFTLRPLKAIQIVIPRNKRKAKENSTLKRTVHLSRGEAIFMHRTTLDTGHSPPEREFYEQDTENVACRPFSGSRPVRATTCLMP